MMRSLFAGRRLSWSLAGIGAGVGVGIGVASALLVTSPVALASVGDDALASAGWDVLVTEPLLAAPVVLSPEPGRVARLVLGPENQWFWVLEVTNSEYQPGYDPDDGYVGFESLPSVGIFDSVEERLEWTNDTFTCFVSDVCSQPAQTADEAAFGDNFIRLPKLFNEVTNTVADHAEHAYQVGQDPYSWLLEQRTLSLAIPLSPTPTGAVDIWVGYTYVYTDDMVGKRVQFTSDAMAVTPATIIIDHTTPVTDFDVLENGEEEASSGIPPWVAQAVLGLVGIIVFFGLLTLTVNKMVVLSRKR